MNFWLFFLGFWITWQTAQSEESYFELILTSGIIAPDGFARQVFLINGQTPGPLISVNQGNIIIAKVINLLPIELSIHWHGLHQIGTPQHDGVPGVTQWAIPPNANYTYRFNTSTQYGSFWYHAHLRGYYEDGLRAPLYIVPNNLVNRPFLSIASQYPESIAILEAITMAEKSPIHLLVYDWSHMESSEILAKANAINETGPSLCADSILFNGKGRVNCPPLLPNSDTKGCSMSMMMSKKRKSRIIDNEMTNLDDCTNTMTNLFFLKPQFTNQSWLYVNLINGGGAQMLTISIDEHDLWIIAADGGFTTPQKVQSLEIGIGQRYGLLIPLNQRPGQYVIRASTRTQQIMQGLAILDYNTSSIEMGDELPASKPWIDVEGNALSNATLLNDATLSPYLPQPFPQNANHSLYFEVNNQVPLEWVLNKYKFENLNGQDVPLLFKPQNATAVYQLEYGEVVDILIQISNMALDDMPHPIHLHGHSFWILGSQKNAVANGTNTEDMIKNGDKVNIINPVLRDSAHLPQGGWLLIRFIANNPGVWLMHCHIEIHLELGMAVAFIEAKEQFPSFPKNLTESPLVQVSDGTASNSQSIPKTIESFALATVVSIFDILFFVAVLLF